MPSSVGKEDPVEGLANLIYTLNVLDRWVAPETGGLRAEFFSSSVGQ